MLLEICLLKQLLDDWPPNNDANKSDILKMPTVSKQEAMNTVPLYKA